jgi:hypothetical protein
MSISFVTSDPKKLLAAVVQAIDNHAANKPGQRIDTWRYVLHQQHYFFTHTSRNWADKAWLRADIEDGKLTFYVRQVQDVPLTRDTYAYYVGHLAETLIRHFPSLFIVARSTPNPNGDDAKF